MMRALLIAIMLLTFALATRATTELGKAPEPVGSFDFVRLPLKRAGNLILIEGKVDDQIGFFILDTGAPYLVLNSTYFDDGRKIEERIMGDVNGGIDTVQVVEVERFELRSLHFDHLEADLTDLGAIENSRGVKVLGLLGLNLFLHLEMRINIQSLFMELHRMDKKGNTTMPIDACDSLMRFDLQLKKNVLLLEGHIADHSMTFCFDTGAEVTMLSSDLPDEVFEHVRITGSMPLVGSSGRAVYVLQGFVQTIEVGAPLRNCRVVISDLSRMSAAFGVPIDGMIGFDLLVRGNVVLNFRKRTFTFCPSI
jgi:hypothetical protein